MVAVNMMNQLLFVLDVSVLTRCEGARVTTMLLREIRDVWLWCVLGMSMWVVQVVKVLCLVQLSCARNVCDAWDERN